MSHFLVRPKSILLGFLKGFFSQESLFDDIPNEFIYKDNRENDSLIISTSYQVDTEQINAFPCIILQEGGFSEDITTIDSRNWSNLAMTNTHISSFYHPITLHCITANKGSCEMLQAITAMAIITFRKGIYEMGVDHITPLQGGPPQLISQQSETQAKYFDATLSLNMKMQQDWWFTFKGDPEEIVKFTLTAALNELEYDSNGDPLEPADEWTRQHLRIQW